MAKMSRDPREKDLMAKVGSMLLDAGSIKELSRRSGLDYKTLQRRCKNVRTFSVWELWALEDAMERR